MASRGARRSGILRALGSVLGATALLAVAACSGSPASAPAESGSPSAAPEPLPSAPYEHTPFDSEVEVVDYGFSSIPFGEGSWTFSYGIILENTSDTAVAWQTHVEIVGESASGERMPVNETVTQAFILPGARVGVGGSLAPFGHDLDELPGDLRIYVRTDEWWPPVNGVHEFVPITVSGIQLTWRENSTVEIYCDAAAEGGPATAADLSVIFRDDEGRVIGGAVPTSAQGLSDLVSGRAWMSLLWGVPDELDPERLEIYAGGLA